MHGPRVENLHGLCAHLPPVSDHGVVLRDGWETLVDNEHAIKSIYTQILQMSMVPEGREIQ